MRFAPLLILALFPPTPTAAQAVAIPPGTRVRVETHQKTSVAGTLMSQTSDSITVASPGVLRTVIASEAVSRIAVSKGRSYMIGAARGMVIGAGIVGGGALGYMAAAYIGAGSSDIGSLFAYAAPGAAVGAMYGAAIGALFSVERWSTVYSAPARVSVRPFTSRAPGLGLSIRF